MPQVQTSTTCSTFSTFPEYGLEGYHIIVFRSQPMRALSTDGSDDASRENSAIQQLHSDSFP